jgi:hypothetical protein
MTNIALFAQAPFNDLQRADREWKRTETSAVSTTVLDPAGLSKQKLHQQLSSNDIITIWLYAGDEMRANWVGKDGTFQFFMDAIVATKSQHKCFMVVRVKDGQTVPNNGVIGEFRRTQRLIEYKELNVEFLSKLHEELLEVSTLKLLDPSIQSFKEESPRIWIENNWTKFIPVVAVLLLGILFYLSDKPLFFGDPKKAIEQMVAQQNVTIGLKTKELVSLRNIISLAEKNVSSVQGTLDLFDKSVLEAARNCRSSIANSATEIKSITQKLYDLDAELKEYEDLISLKTTERSGKEEYIRSNKDKGIVVSAIGRDVEEITKVLTELYVKRATLSTDMNKGSTQSETLKANLSLEESKLKNLTKAEEVANKELQDMNKQLALATSRLQQLQQQEKELLSELTRVKNDRNNALTQLM